MNTESNETIDLSVVIPCYNEECGISELLRRVKLACQNTNLHYEILLIDDGSSDSTWEKLNQYYQDDSTLSILRLSRNHGHQLALTAGLSKARSKKYIFVMDADLQDPPELLSPMLQLMQNEGADVVYGQRKHRAGESHFKLITASLFYRTLRFLTSVNIPADTGDFRLMTRRVLDVFLDMPEHARFIRGMISWIGFKQIPILYDRDPRFAGTTKYPLSKMLKLAFDAITSFSIKPLQISIIAGGLFAFLGICGFIYSLISYFFFHTVKGWTSLVSMFSIMSSVQFIILGVIGEYIGRIYLESQRRPLFMIADYKSSHD